MHHISHTDARRLIIAMDCPADVREALLIYVAGNAAPDNWDNQTTAQHAARASARAIEAISRAGTLQTDLTALQAEVRHQRELIDMLIEIAAKG
jgi:hypothetical protein